MGTLYADRGFISFNGIELVDVESITVTQNDGTKYVPTMSRNRRHTGTVKANRDINVSFSVAVQNKLGSPKIENLDFDNNSVALTFEHGADRYTLTDMNFVSAEQAASGVGSEGKKNFTMLALDIIDQVGNSALFPTSVPNIA
jgi:hypothetical protein